MERITAEFADRVLKMLPGKRVGGDVYLHRDTLTRHGHALHGTLSACVAVAGATFRWNVCKLSPRRQRLSLLYYPRFRDDAHPALAAAASFDLDRGVGRVRHYSAQGNRPILHRKELLLDASDPDYARFAALTNQEEQAGLFATPSIIGHERAWSERLSQCGLMIRDHDLCKAGE